MDIRKQLFPRIAAAVFALGLGAACVSVASAATVQPPSTLIKPGQIVYCSDISSPPFESYTANGKPVGEDVQLGDAIASLMGLKAVWRNTQFSGIIPALEAKQCDAILSGMIDKAARRKVVDFVDYLSLGNIIVVPKGNPHHVENLAGLSGLTVAVEIGTNNQAELQAENAMLKKAGKKPMSIEAFPVDTAAFQQLEVGHVDAYFTAQPTAAALSAKTNGQTELVGQLIGALPFGIATTKQNKALHNAIAEAFNDLRKNGEYIKILTAWGLQGTALKG